MAAAVAMAAAMAVGLLLTVAAVSWCGRSKYLMYTFGKADLNQIRDAPDAFFRLLLHAFTPPGDAPRPTTAGAIMAAPTAAAHSIVPLHRPAHCPCLMHTRALAPGVWLVRPFLPCLPLSFLITGCCFGLDLELPHTPAHATGREVYQIEKCFVMPCPGCPCGALRCVQPVSWSWPSASIPPHTHSLATTCCCLHPVSTSLSCAGATHVPHPLPPAPIPPLHFQCLLLSSKTLGCTSLVAGTTSIRVAPCL